MLKLATVLTFFVKYFFLNERNIDMTTFERIKNLAKNQGKSLNTVEEELGYGKNVLYRLKTTNPSAERLQEIADYFGVSVDYLLGREDKASLAEKHGVFAFDGEPVTDEEVEFLKSVLAAKRAAEKK
jgi:transcriptional regulator with XRE-family HTH domain|uniref:Repressor protein n=1 Tax=Siphoviridae sp. ctBrh2 TaxID=2827804 RepID=A0A8S5S7Q8_9CAUD|nr:MAG TPA: repressor protein [Siphoviridae sp. ctBrh2]